MSAVVPAANALRNKKSVSAECVRGGCRRSPPAGTPETLDEPCHEQDPDRQHERVGRDGEEHAGLPDPTEVRVRDERHEHDCELDLSLLETGGGRHDRVHTRGDGDGNREHVVDEERRTRSEPREETEILVRDDVGAAAAGIGTDRFRYETRPSPWSRPRPRS